MWGLLWYILIAHINYAPTFLLDSRAQKLGNTRKRFSRSDWAWFLCIYDNMIIGMECCFLKIFEEFILYHIQRTFSSLFDSQVSTGHYQASVMNNKLVHFFPFSWYTVTLCTKPLMLMFLMWHKSTDEKNRDFTGFSEVFSGGMLELCHLPFYFPTTSFYSKQRWAFESLIMVKSVKAGLCWFYE